MNTRKWFVSLLFVVCLVLAACALAISTPTIPPYYGTATAEASKWPVEFVWQINGRGPDNPNGLGRPTGLAVDSQSNLYVVDGANHRIQKFDTSGKLLTMWGTYGSGDGQFMFRVPSGHFGDVAVDSQDNVYVTDNNERVQKFDSNGRFLMKWGSRGNGDGQFASFIQIAADQLGNVFVADGDNYRIQKFDGNGKFLLQWGDQGSGDGEFGANDNANGPAGVAVDRQGNVYVADPGNYRIEKFDNNGKFLVKWGSVGTGSGQFSLPSGIAVDSQGTVYVTDNSLDNVSMFDSNGKFLYKWGEAGTDEGMLNFPQGIAVDRQGNVYVVNVIENV